MKYLKSVLLVSLLFSFSFFPSILFAESLPYEVKEDRFSFAQLYLSADYSQYAIKSPLLTGDNHESSIFVPSLTIGGLHYWGKADFYVTFPFRQNYNSGNISYRFSPGIETGFKYYPVAIKNKSFRGFIGTGFSFPSYQQTTENTQGSEQSKFILTGNVGISYTLSPFIFDVGAKYTPDSHLDYYLSSDEKKRADYSDHTFYISVKWYTDTTLSARQEPRNSFDLPEGFYPYIGIGPSSAWSMNDSSFVDNSHPYLDIKNDPVVFPELSAGVHWKNINRKGHRTIFNISYRPQKIQKEGFGIKNTYTNNSLAFEVFQSFWDYHGFVPFAGVSYAINQLEFTEGGANDNTKKTEQSNDLGAVFGWDILPTHQSSWFLRTTFRYYPEITIDTHKGKIQFPNFEFNFIQFIYQF